MVNKWHEVWKINYGNWRCDVTSHRWFMHILLARDLKRRYIFQEEKKKKKKKRKEWKK